MQCGYLFILITQRGKHQMAPSKCITRRGLGSQTTPAIFLSLRVLCLSPEAAQHSTKAAIR